MKPGRLRTVAVALAAVPAAGLVLAALAPTGWFPAQLAGHWAAHLAALCLPLWCLAGRQPAIGGGLLLVAAAALWPHIRAAHADAAAEPSPDAHTAVSANLYFLHEDHRESLARLAALDPDLMALIETQAGDRELLRGDPRWPHQAWQTPRRFGGIGLLSRWPMQAQPISIDEVTGYDARIATPSGPLRVIALHTWSPRDSRRMAANLRQLTELAGLAATEPGPLLVMGDLNASPASPGMSLLRAAGLEHPAGGEVRSWPSWLGPAGIAIDHVLSRRLALGGAEPIDLPGSDHHAIMVRFGPLR